MTNSTCHKVRCAAGGWLTALCLAWGFGALTSVHATTYPYPAECTGAGGTATCVEQMLSPTMYVQEDFATICNTNARPVFSSDMDAWNAWKSTLPQEYGSGQCPITPTDLGYFSPPATIQAYGCGSALSVPSIDSAGR